MTLYEKRGRRYVRVNDPYCLDGLSLGTYVVQVKQGSTSATRIESPDYPTLEAALVLLRDEMVIRLTAWADRRWQPDLQPMTKAEQAVFAEWMRVSKRPLMATVPCAWDVADQCIAWLRQQMKRKGA